jgi:hypothetical protein
LPFDSRTTDSILIAMRSQAELALVTERNPICGLEVANLVSWVVAPADFLPTVPGGVPSLPDTVLRPDAVNRSDEATLFGAI